MNRSDNDGSDMQASITKKIFDAAAQGNANDVVDGFSLLPSLSRDCKDERGWTPIMLAARNGHVDVIQALLKDGADPKVFNSSGQNALEIASFWNQGPALKALTEFLQSPTPPRLEFVNFFSHGVVNRQSYRRTDEAEIQTVMKSDKARFVVFAELRLLVTNMQPPQSGCQILYLTWTEIEKVLVNIPESERDIIFLGVGDIGKGVLLREAIETDDDKYAYFGINFKNAPTEEQLPIAERHAEFVGRGPRGYNTGITSVKKQESGLVAQARSVLAWHEKNLFCPACGNKTDMAESGYKRVCTNSDCVSRNGTHNISFPRTDPVVIVLVVSTDGTKCLLGRQKRFPPGVYSCVAGFMEPGETIEDAARREVMEEAGVKVGRLEYHSSQPWPFPSNIMIGLIGNATCDDIKVDEVELEDAKWFDRSDAARAVVEGFKSEGLKIPPVTAIAHQLIKSWVKMSSNL